MGQGVERSTGVSRSSAGHVKRKQLLIVNPNYRRLYSSRLVKCRLVIPRTIYSQITTGHNAKKEFLFFPSYGHCFET
ncbi:hypothetical protein CEXT_58141 [Caerostris extrusa]|uniref:Uncharacterized protein n=1 Tax=Caerostris extrusa TaxID=172846 RepID=A0AAV4MUH1_CAEEX|nr:hypothetical protein CEXT_58141 [Caerostris extrusa]